MTQEKNETKEAKEQISNIIRVGRKAHSVYINACVRVLKDNDTILLQAKGINISSAFIVAVRLEEETGLCKINQELTRAYNESFNGKDNRTRKLTTISITMDKTV